MTILRRTSLLLPLALGLLAGCEDRPIPLAPDPVPGGPSLLEVRATGFTQVSTSSHTCALRDDATVDCWIGVNTHGQANVPAGLSDVAEVSTGRYHTCARKSDGTVVCWGNHKAEDDMPTDLTGFVGVDAGGNQTCAVKGDGTVVCWGSTSVTEGASMPPADLMDAVQVAVGALHACALLSDATLRCWGDNSHSQRDHPSGTFVQISAGDFDTCALRADGTVACWGDDRTELSSPPQDLTNATQVSTGLFRACALRSDGTVTCWGDAPSIPPDVANATQVSIRGRGGLCVLKRDTTIVCYEAPGPEADVVYPAADFSATPASVAAGEDFTLALMNAEVPGHPEATEFTYAFDCGDGSGYSDFGTGNTVSCPATTVGTRTVKGKVRDEDNDETAYEETVQVTYLFVGFEAPVSSDGVNAAKAGRTIPLKWRLIDGSGAPVTSIADVRVETADTPCEGGGSGESVEESAAGKSGLQNLGDGYYQFNWKTPKSYAQMCKTLHLDLGEGLTRTAMFRFTK